MLSHQHNFTEIDIVIGGNTVVVDTSNVMFNHSLYPFSRLQPQDSITENDIRLFCKYECQFCIIS